MQIFSGKSQISWADYKHWRHQYRPWEGTVYFWLEDLKLSKRCTSISRIFEFLQTICITIFTAHKTADQAHKRRVVQHKIWKETSQISLIWMDQGVSKGLWRPKTHIHHGPCISTLQYEAGNMGWNWLFQFCNSKDVLANAQWHA